MKNIKDFTPKSLDGEKLETTDLNKLIGNGLYFSANDIATIDLAKKIYNEDDFEPTEKLQESVLSTPQVAFWLKDQFVEFLKQE